MSYNTGFESNNFFGISTTLLFNSDVALIIRSIQKIFLNEDCQIANFGIYQIH